MLLVTYRQILVSIIDTGTSDTRSFQGRAFHMTGLLQILHKHNFNKYIILHPKKIKVQFTNNMKNNLAYKQQNTI